MEIPRYAPAPREPGGGPPAIYVEHPSNRFDSGRSHNTHSAFSSSIPMSIPSSGYTAEDLAPPPLPPPKFFPHMQPPPPDFKHERGRSFDSNGSWESPRRESVQERMGFGRESGPQGGLPRFPPKDEGYHSLNSTVSVGYVPDDSSVLVTQSRPPLECAKHSPLYRSQESLPKKLFMSHDQFQLNKPSLKNDFDSSLLKKLDSRRTFDNYSPPRRSALSQSANEPVTRSELHPQQQLPHLSLPIRPSHKSLLESPGRYTDTPLHTPSFHDYRSPIEPTEADRSLFARAKRTNSGSIPDDMTVSTHSSVEFNGDDTEFPMEETSGMRKLYIDDHMIRPDYQTAGHKRRAVSPPGDDIPMQGFPGSAELLRRREGAARASPTPRLTVIPQGSSMSSMSSTGRSASYASNISIPGSSMSSMNSYGRRSPGGLSTGGLSPVDICNSPFNNPISLGHSPRTPLGRALPHQHQHQRNVSGESRGSTLASPRKVTEVPKSSLNKIQGGFRMCECCPKKPKKFETEEELR